MQHRQRCQSWRKKRTAIMELIMNGRVTLISGVIASVLSRRRCCCCCCWARDTYQTRGGGGERRLVRSILLFNVNLLPRSARSEVYSKKKTEESRRIGPRPSRFGEGASIQQGIRAQAAMETTTPHVLGGAKKNGMNPGS